MLINLFNFIIHNFMFFTGAYSNNAFPEPLSKEEEEEYINKMLHGDTNARSKLIEHNLRLVAHIVKKFESNTSFNLVTIFVNNCSKINLLSTFCNF